MGDSVQAAGMPGKGGFGVNPVPPPAVPPPGPQLVNLIRLGRQAGCPVWRVNSLVTPHIDRVADHDPETGEPMLYQPLAVHRDRRPYFRRRVLLYLETSEPAALDMLQEHDRAELRRLTAAALADLAAYSKSGIADSLGYTDERTAQRAYASGRKLWRYLHAWPWCYWAEGSPPSTWRGSGPDATLAAALQTWATGEPVLAPQTQAA